MREKEDETEGRFRMIGRERERGGRETEREGRRDVVREREKEDGMEGRFRMIGRERERERGREREEATETKQKINEYELKEKK